MNQMDFYQAKLDYETDAWDLSEMIKSGAKLTIVDTRSPEAYALEHIPTSINLPHRFISEETTKLLDRHTLYITYCDGIGCNASTKGALKLSKSGFEVKELLGGLDWWKRDGYETEGTQATKGKTVSCGC